MTMGLAGGLALFVVTLPVMAVRRDENKWCLPTFCERIKFDALKSEAERSYFKQLPTSFSLEAEQVDRLRDAAKRILDESREFQRLLTDLQR